jgi:Clostridium epsilon toxin ETX/Bacillus mosquitocidal toxin MTX2
MDYLTVLEFMFKTRSFELLSKIHGNSLGAPGDRKGLADKESKLLKIDVSNVYFDLDHAIIGSPQIVDQLTQVLTNDTDTEQESIFKFEIDYIETRNWSTILGTKGNIQTTITAGFPFIAEGKIQIASEVSSSITWGTAVTIARKYSAEIPVKIPPHSKVTCKASVSISKVTIPYSAEAVYHFSGGGGDTREKLTDTYEGATAYELQASWTMPLSM